MSSFDLLRTNIYIKLHGQLPTARFSKLRETINCQKKDENMEFTDLYLYVW